MKRCVIIGAGASGLSAAQYLYDHLPKDYAVTVIDRREYYYHLIAAVRANVAPVDGEKSWPQSICVPLSGVFSKCKFKPEAGQVRGEVLLGEVVSLDSPTSLTYRDIAKDEKKQLEYEYLIIASGSKWIKPLTPPSLIKDAVELMSSFAKEVSEKKNILVVGAGAVGTEFAAEIKAFYKDTRVVLLHNEKAPLTNVYSDKFRLTLKKKLEAMGVQYVGGERLANVAEVSSTHKEGESVKTESGLVIKSIDLIIASIGPQQRNSEFAPVSKDPTGLLNVSSTFQLKAEGWSNVFAVGDIARIEGFEDEVRQLGKYDKHASVAAGNIVKLIQKAPLQAYTGAVEMIAVSLGPKDGYGWANIFGGMRLPSFLITPLKSKDLLRKMIADRYRAAA